jgi:hypothetical protein
MKMDIDTLSIDEFVLKSLNESLNGKTVYQIRCGPRHEEGKRPQNQFNLYDMRMANLVNMNHYDYISRLFDFGMDLHSFVCIILKKEDAEKAFDWVQSMLVVKKLKGQNETSIIWN